MQVIIKDIPSNLASEIRAKAPEAFKWLGVLIDYRGLEISIEPVGATYADLVCTGYHLSSEEYQRFNAFALGYVAAHQK